MLSEITLKNFTIADGISVSFTKGLNIITGETGAGKSIIVDALDVILGGKTSADLIKSGCDEASVEALFVVNDSGPVKQRAESLGFDISSGELLVKRTISRGVRGKVFINGSPATLSLLEKVTQDLADIFSQHEHQTLLRKENHVKVLDEAAGHDDILSVYGSLYKSYLSLKREYDALMEDREDLARRLDFLKFQRDEISRAELTPGEDRALEDERRVLMNSEKLLTAAETAYETLYENERSVLGALKKIYSELDTAASMDGSLKPAAEAIEKSIVQIEEAAYGLRDYSSGFELEEGRLDTIEERLESIKTLKRKYGGTVEEILDKKTEIEAELDRIENREDAVTGLKMDIEAALESLSEKAERLSESRRKTAAALSADIERELAHVGIKSARFQIDFREKGLSQDGRDDIEFLFSANPDESPKPLNRVASGGELSRIMLVLKELMTRREGESVIIFDEADSGIGGAVAETVGRKISGLSLKNQVICITHLAQVAKFADSHIKVSKSVSGSKTSVDVKKLDREARVEELARMIGGISVTEKTREAAHEMLNQ